VVISSSIVGLECMCRPHVAVQLGPTGSSGCVAPSRLREAGHQYIKLEIDIHTPHFTIFGIGRGACVLSAGESLYVRRS
jgi:hypothetical protein